MTMLSTSQYSWFDDQAPTNLPFTVFGQYGEDGFDIRVLEQDEWWVNINGEPMLLADMPQEYLRNIKTMLYKKAIVLHASYIQKTMDEIIKDYTQGKINGDILNYEMTGTTVADMPHEEWLASMPLLKRINQILKD